MLQIQYYPNRYINRFLNLQIMSLSSFSECINVTNRFNLILQYPILIIQRFFEASYKVTKLLQKQFFKRLNHLEL